MIGTNADLTPQKNIEQALLESEKRWRDLTRLAPVVICQGDLQGKLTYINGKL